MVKYSADGGIRYKKRQLARKDKKRIKWVDRDEDYRSMMKFGEMVIHELKKEMDGYEFKQTFWKGRPYVVVKKDGKLSAFFVPFMKLEYYDDFVAGIKFRLEENFDKKVLDSKDK